jgi:5-methylcytosine-specific restriction endonuclease McrA
VPAGYCSAHTQRAPKAVYDQTRRKDDPRLAEAARIRSGVAWQKVRKMHRAYEPLCCDPFSDHPHEPRANQTSHHIIPLVERPDLAYDMKNLAPLCTRCHAKLERMEREGKATRGLFAARAA